MSGSQRRAISSISLFHEPLGDSAPDALVRQPVRSRAVDGTTEKPQLDVLIGIETPASIGDPNALRMAARARKSCSSYSFAKPR